MSRHRRLQRTLASPVRLRKMLRARTTRRARRWAREWLADRAGWDQPCQHDAGQAAAVRQRLGDRLADPERDHR